MTVENPGAGQGPVLLDIGGDIGALVVTMPPELVGVEVEIRPIDDAALLTGDHDHITDRDHWPGTGRGAHEHHGAHSHDHDRHDHDHPVTVPPHVAVVARSAGGSVIPSLVFPELRAGSYELYQRPAGSVELRVRIVGAEVTQATWP
jgi:hypothetical protein